MYDADAAELVNAAANNMSCVGMRPRQLVLYQHTAFLERDFSIVHGTCCRTSNTLTLLFEYGFWLRKVCLQKVLYPSMLRMLQLNPF